MMEFLADTYYGVAFYVLSVVKSGRVINLFLYYFPFVLVLEMPFYMFTVAYSIKSWLILHRQKGLKFVYTPMATIIVSAYGETYDELLLTYRSINEQIYDGVIQTLIIVDNALANKKTEKMAKALAEKFDNGLTRQFRVISKMSRGGLANSRNLGLRFTKGEFVVCMDADTSMDNTTIAHTAKHFRDPHVIAVSGAVRIRNQFDSITTIMQSIEYMLSIQFGRLGLTELGVVNNISGAFGIFRTSFVRQIGGWLNGTAEDLDMTLRMHVYLSRYPWLKVIHEPFSIAWTGGPATFKELMKQRLRWDGDLYYIYVRRHWRFFSTKLITFKKLFFIAWYGLYFQLILPAVVVCYLMLIIIKFSYHAIIAMFVMLYFYYLVITFMMFFLFLLLVSERPKDDSRFIKWLFINPLYNMVIRITAFFFLMNEILFKGHQDSSMAPWWVIRKTK
ncbi:MAG: glycosyltransferase [Legionellaceae bacterium]|nr:glycosyltransferase [Legionellaceae bacterium]